MKYILLKRSKKFYASVAVLGLVNSLLYSSLLLFINSVLTGTPMPFFPRHGWVLFGVLVSCAMVCSKAFQTYMIRLTNEILFDFELSILERLRQSAYSDFEKLGNEKVYTAMGDTRAL